MTENDKTFQTVLEWVRTLAVAIIIAILFKVFIGDTTKVQGNSMNNTLHNNDLLFVDKISMNLSGIERSDIVIIDAPEEKGVKYIKRVIGLPGDEIKIEDGKVYVNGNIYPEDYINTDYTETTTQTKDWILDDDQYFVMGDNRIPGQSNDSRTFGPIERKHIIGHAVFRILPFGDFGFIGKA